MFFKNVQNLKNGIFFAGEEIKQQYQQLAQALDEYVRKTFNEWTTTVDKDTSNLLDVPLMCRSTHQLGMLELNFDRYNFIVKRCFMVYVITVESK